MYWRSRRRPVHHENVNDVWTDVPPSDEGEPVPTKVAA
jgi:hypothetical protein